RKDFCSNCRQNPRRCDEKCEQLRLRRWKIKSADVPQGCRRGQSEEREQEDERAPFEREPRWKSCRGPARNRRRRHDIEASIQPCPFFFEPVDLQLDLFNLVL